MITRITDKQGSKEVSEDVTDSKIIKFETKNKTPYLITAVVLVIILGLAIYFFVNRTYGGYRVDSTMERADETQTEYLSFLGGFVKYNVNGITYEDKTGTIIWTEAFTMSDPKVVMNGEYVALTDIGKNQYTLYNATKKIQTFKTDYPVTDIQIAKQGMVVVVLEDEKVNYIVGYDQSGEKLVEIKTSINKNGYPLAIALSDDGQKLVASYVTIHDTQLENSLTFYNFGSVGKNEVDRQVGYKKFDDELFPRVEFANNDTVCTFSNKRLVIYGMKQKPKEICDKKLPQNVKSIFCNDHYVGYISKNSVSGQKKTSKEKDATVKSTVEKSGETSDNYTLKAFDLNGIERLSQNIDFSYTKMHATEDEIVLLSDNKCQIYKYNGFIKFNGNFREGISDFFPTTRKNHYVLITNNATKMIHLK